MERDKAMLNYYLDSVDNGKKMWLATFWAIGMLSFAGVTLFHLEIWAQNQELNVRTVALGTDFGVNVHN